MKNKNVLDITMRICFGITLFFMFTIVTRFFTRQILVEKLDWNNLFTQIVFWGDENMGDASGIADEKEKITININWAEKYPFPSENQIMTVEQRKNTMIDEYENLIIKIEEKIEMYTGKFLFGHSQITKVGKVCNEFIGCENMTLNGVLEVIELNNGHLTYEQHELSDEDLSVLADNVSALSNYLEERGIFFTYVNVGSKVCPNDKQLPSGATEYTNENADRLIGLLQERSVNTLDFRVWQQERYSNWYESYYITDHHWKTTTSLEAAGVLAEYLNTNAGFSFDMEFFDKDNYSITTNENYFLGGPGRMLTTALIQPESYDKIIPNFDTSLSIQIPSKGIDKTGSYEETLFDADFYETIAEYSLDDHNEKKDAYHAVAWTNDALGTVQNHMDTSNDGKRILMIQDSFGWYLSTYLALDVEEIDYLNLNSFTGSLQTYIEETEPDVVVLLLCGRNIKEFDEFSHTHFFDFR